MLAPTERSDNRKEIVAARSIQDFICSYAMLLFRSRAARRWVVYLALFKRLHLAFSWTSFLLFWLSDIL